MKSILQVISNARIPNIIETLTGLVMVCIDCHRAVDLTDHKVGDATVDNEVVKKLQNVLRSIHGVREGKVSVEDLESLLKELNTAKPPRSPKRTKRKASTVLSDSRPSNRS